MDPVENTDKARLRKMIVTVLALVAVTVVTIMKGDGITLYTLIAYLGITWAFVSSDTLDAAFENGALGKLKNPLAKP